MSTAFTRNISMLVPPQHYLLAGDLVSVISGQRSDRQHFQSPVFQPDYAACNHAATPEHVQVLLAVHAGAYVPPRPAFDVNNELDIPALMQVLQSAQIITETTDTLVPGVIVIGIDMTVDAIAGMTNLIKVQGE